MPTLCLSTLNIKNKALLESRHYNDQHGKIQTDDEEIAKLLNYQFASVFPQDDGSSPLKELEEVANPLVLIFNASLIERIPNDWKHATITSLYKGENKSRSKVENYRPISLISVVCKIIKHFPPQPFNKSPREQMNFN